MMAPCRICLPPSPRSTCCKSGCAHDAGLTLETTQRLQKRLPRVLGPPAQSSLTEIAISSARFGAKFRPPPVTGRGRRADHSARGVDGRHSRPGGGKTALPTVPLPIKIAVYWVLQEALFNVQHRRSIVTDVRLGMQDGSLCLTTDEGAGFFDALAAPAAENEEKAGHHIGLRGMRYRAHKMVGGALRFIVLEKAHASR